MVTGADRRVTIRYNILVRLTGLLWLFVASGCAGSDGPGGSDAGFVTDVPAFDDDPGVRSRAHAHNDYEQAEPLFDALDQRFYSVEADVFLSSDELSVAHDPWEYYGSIRELYLDPLQDLVDARGSVYGDGAQFTLWIDIKESSDDTTSMLQSTLSDYAMLSRFGPGQTEGPVLVVLTGDAANKQRYVDSVDVRHAVRDANGYDSDDPDADDTWTHYALKWADYVDAAEKPALSPAEEAALADLVEAAHGKGRRVRFYGAPDTEAIWRASLEAGVDYINTDDLTGLAGLLAEVEAAVP